MRRSPNCGRSWRPRIRRCMTCTRPSRMHISRRWSLCWTTTRRRNTPNGVPSARSAVSSKTASSQKESKEVSGGLDGRLPQDRIQSLSYRLSLLAGAAFFVLLFEPLDAARRVDEFLFTGVEGVAVGADFHADVALMRG